MSSYRITNISKNTVSFDNTALPPSKSVLVARLTPDIMSGLTIGVLVSDPPVTAQDIQLAEAIALAFAQLTPLPVLLNGAINVTPNRREVINGYNPEAPVPPDTALEVFSYDQRRAGFRIRNAGAFTVAIGGAGLQWATRVNEIAPGAIHEESFAPVAAWYVVADPLAPAPQQLYMEAYYTVYS